MEQNQQVVQELTPDRAFDNMVRGFVVRPGISVDENIALSQSVLIVKSVVQQHMANLGGQKKSVEANGKQAEGLREARQKRATADKT